MNRSSLIRKFLPPLSLVLSGLLILGTPFATDALIPNGLITAQTNWFAAANAIFAFSAAVVLSFGPRLRLSFTWADGLVSALAAIILLTYDWDLHPEPDKLGFGAQLLIFWFIMRYALSSYPFLRWFFPVGLMAAGLLEALLGFAQLYGYAASNHPLFRLTGSFFNPGPYSGYLAVVLPVCFGLLLRTGRLGRQENGQLRRQGRGRLAAGLYLFSWICLLTLICILPAGMSRSAWLAALVACGWVYWVERLGWKKTARWIQCHPLRAWFGAIALGMVFSGGVLFLYHLKKGSADGRLLMWKITATAILRHPFCGVGLGGFPAAYAQEQAAYFGSAEKPAEEQRVAGCPEYAFNEYLQFGLETGIPGACLFVGWLAYCGWKGLKRRRYAVCGGLIALAVFAFSSYPLQLPSFWVAGVILSVCALSPPPARKAAGEWGIRATFWLLAAVSLWMGWKGYSSVADYQKWATARMLYRNRAYGKAVVSYTKLFPLFRHRPDFLFEGAQCLRKTGREAEAIGWLQRAVRLSADPMLYDVMALNEQSLGRYAQAEKHLRYAIAILPDRIYPYYLLAKLYAEPAFFQPEKMQEAVRVVMERKPKVESTAIREMREELKQAKYRLLNKCKIKNNIKQI